MRNRILTLTLLVGAVAGCTSSKPPSQTVTASRAAASLSTSPSPTGYPTTGPNVRAGEKPPTLPVRALEHDTVGAILFARYYWQSLDWALATNDPYPIERISGPDCDACRRAVQAIRSLKNEHQVVTGGRIRVIGVGIGAGRFNYKADVIVRTETLEEPEWVRKGQQKPRQVSTQLRDVHFVFLNRLSEGWTVVGVRQ